MVLDARAALGASRGYSLNPSRLVKRTPGRLGGRLTAQPQTVGAWTSRLRRPIFGHVLNHSGFFREFAAHLAKLLLVEFLDANELVLRLGGEDKLV